VLGGAVTHLFKSITLKTTNNAKLKLCPTETMQIIQSVGQGFSLAGKENHP
jgi:hypothetical protein